VNLRRFNVQKIQCEPKRVVLNLLSFNVNPMLILEDSMQIQCMKIQCESKSALNLRRLYEDSMYTESQKIQCESKRVYIESKKIQCTMHSI